MSETRISNIQEPSVFLEYMSEEIPEKFVFLMESGVMQAPPSEVADQFHKGGTIIDMPYWDDLGREEPIIPDDDPNSEAVPAHITADDERATKHVLVKPWSAMDVAGMVATGDTKDPMRQIAMKSNRYWYSQTEKRMIGTAIGVMADNFDNDSGDMIASVYSDVTTPTASNKISTAAVNEAKLTMGDHMDDFTVIAMHSHVYNTLKNNHEISFRTPSETPTKIPYYQDMLVMFSDELPVTAGSNSSKYTCYLMGAGSFSYIDYLDPTPTQNGVYSLETDRKMLAGSGGGQDIMIQRRRQFLHPRGISWTNTTRAKKMGASLAELKLSANWSRKYVRKNIKIAALEVNV